MMEIKGINRQYNNVKEFSNDVLEQLTVHYKPEEQIEFAKLLKKGLLDKINNRQSSLLREQDEVEKRILHISEWKAKFEEEMNGG